ncbi:MAG: hypothetical protein JO169_05385, partial [Solirubrobacterales bacterium]|nr:hypothetical protein [Solirubrobacterales bacterium]
MTGGRLWLSRSALVAALLLLPASSGLSAESSPGAVPPQCGDDPTVLQAGGEPTPGLDGPAPGGCLIQSWAATFALSPHVLHVGQKLTGTVETTGKLNGVGWSWSNFTAEMQLGSHKPRLHCADNAPTCTVIVGPNVVSSVYQVYSQGLNTPLGGAVSSDYFIVNNDLQELSGRVDYQNDGKRTPAAGIELAARTGRRAEHASTGPDGKYSFVLHRGNYSVSVVGKEAQPSSHEVSLGANVSGVDFLTGCIGHPTFVVVHVKQGAETTFGYQGTNWDVGGCGPVTVGAVGEKGPVQELQRTYTTDEFKFAARGKGRFCGADFFAQQPQSGRSLKAGWTSGHSTAAHVVFANPTLDANGEDLFPGDVLCEQDLGSAVGAVDSGNIDGATVTAIAQHLGLKTLAIQVGQDVVMADSEGKVSVS